MNDKITLNQLKSLIKECEGYAPYDKSPPITLRKKIKEFIFSRFGRNPDYISSFTVIDTFIPADRRRTGSWIPNVLNLLYDIRRDLEGIQSETFPPLEKGPIDRRIEEMNLKKRLHNEEFWKNFVIKAKDIEYEKQLWDFKESFQMWHTKDLKDSIHFCEQVASFANAEGGVLIVGISDKIPRIIKGVSDLENKKKHCASSLQKNTNHPLKFCQFQEIKMKDLDNKEKTCLIIIIMQTNDVISVRRINGTFSYPIRLETGLERIDEPTIKRQKEGIENNYNFLKDLDLIVNN